MPLGGGARLAPLKAQRIAGSVGGSFGELHYDHWYAIFRSRYMSLVQLLE